MTNHKEDPAKNPPFSFRLDPGPYTDPEMKLDPSQWYASLLDRASSPNRRDFCHLESLEERNSSAVNSGNDDNNSSNAANGAKDDMDAKQDLV